MQPFFFPRLFMVRLDGVSERGSTIVHLLSCRQFVFSSAADSAAVRLDDCTFHESVDVSSFEATQTLVVSPPEGEVLN